MEKKLKFNQTIVVASTLFGMFFGAGNLIFPVHLGQIAGRNAIISALGFIITAVGIPILGVAAIGATHSNGLQDLALKVSKKFSFLFTCILYLTIGPFFAIPRCATTSFTVGISPLVSASNQKLLLLLFSLVFFSFVLFFSLRPNGIKIWIGKIINPLFLFFLFILIVVSILHPSASVSSVEPASSYLSNSFFNGFLEGYGTMDAIAGLAFGIIIINVVKSFGVKNDSIIASDVLKAGIFTGILMAAIYLLTIIMGAQSRGLFPVSENGGIALAQIAKHYLGTVGSIVLAFTITLACVKTAIGLVTSCSETFSKIFPKISYNLWTMIISGFSFVVSNIGLSKIIEYAVPVLMFIYPIAILLIILALIGKFFKHNKYVYRFVILFTAFAAIFDFFKTLPASVQNTLHLNSLVNFAGRFLPFFNLGLGWLIPSLIGFIIGFIFYKTKKK